ncbi:MAG: hypothetical protein IH950_02175 [Bacteroidetes bacterium]|nr:hypothetical protein [Bacteroidota bacterium]
MEEFIKPIIYAIFSGLSLGGVIVFWLRKHIDFGFSEKNKRIEAERKAMDNFLQRWYERRSDYSKEWLSAFTKSVMAIMLWCPNNVLYHIGMYMSLFGKPESEIHFGKAILCYRRTLGYKNRWWNRRKVTPEQIILIYCAGNKEKLQ